MKTESENEPLAKGNFKAFYESSARNQGPLDKLGQLRYQRALSLTDLPKDGRVLDLGCKRGSLPSLLETNANRTIAYTGVDIASLNIERNRARWPEATFVQADITQILPFESASFDRIFALEVMEHVSSPGAMLREASRLLSPRGELLLSVPNPYYWVELLNELRGAKDTQGHLFSWNRASLGRLLETCQLQVVNQIGTYFEVPTALRDPWARGRLMLWRNPPRLLARSTIVRCRAMPAAPGAEN
ncbi:MAG: class I SAM-dependent methyltransferase [Burkholderiaceae bacterium]